MDGLINQARAQLWEGANGFATAENGRKSPALRVALYGYDYRGLPSDGGDVRQVLPLTDDALPLYLQGRGRRSTRMGRR